MSGGFFRGTSAEQDTRFSNKQAKLLKTQRFAAELENPVDMTRVKMDVIKPWIATRATELLGFEDEVLINFVYELLDGKEVDGKQIQIQLTGFLEKNTGKFMKELWALLLSAQSNASGVPQQFLDAKEEEMKKRKVESDMIIQEIQKRKDKEEREYEQEKQKRMDVEAGNSRSANAVSGSSSRYSLPRDSRVQSEKSREMEALQGPTLKERRTSSPSRSLSKSPSKSGNSKDGRSRSVSVSSQSHGHSVSPRRKDPSSPRRTMSSGRQYKSPVRRSITPRRRYSPQRNRSPSRHRSLHSRRRSPSIQRHRSPSPMRRRSPYGRRSPPALRHRSPPSRRRPPIQSRRSSPSPGRRRGSPSTRRRRSPSPARRQRSPSPLHRRRSPSPPHRRRSPSPARRQRSPSPPHRRRSPSPPHRRRSPSPPHRRRSPSPARNRRSLSPAHHGRSPGHHRISLSPPHRRISHSPSRRRISSSPAHRIISPSPTHHRISSSPYRRKSPSPAHQRISPSQSHHRTSPSPSRRRFPVRNRSLSPARRKSMSPPRRSSLKRSMNSSRKYDADSQISARAKKRNHSPHRSSSSSDLARRDSSRETDSRSNGFDTKKYQEEHASERPSEKRPSVHDALNREVAEHSGPERGVLDRVPRQLAGASKSPSPNSRDRNDILDKDHDVPSENSSEQSGSPSYSRRTRSQGRDRQSTEKQIPHDISRMNGDKEQASLYRDNAYQKTDSSSKKGKDSSENMKKKRFHPNKFDEEEYTNNGLATDHSPGNQGHPSNISFRKESERARDVDLPTRDARELSGSGDDLEYGPGKSMSRTDVYKDSHHEAEKSKRKMETSSQAHNIHSDSEEETADTRKHKSGEKRKHKKHNKHRRERDSEDSSETESDIEDKKEAKRRKKEERRLRKEEKRLKREEKHRRRSHHHSGKHKLKSMDTVTPPPSDLDKDYNGSGGLNDEAPPRKGSSHVSDVEAAEEKKLEIQLREKALETLRARKGVGH